MTTTFALGSVLLLLGALVVLCGASRSGGVLVGAGMAAQTVSLAAVLLAHVRVGDMSFPVLLVPLGVLAILWCGCTVLARAEGIGESERR